MKNKYIFPLIALLPMLAEARPSLLTNEITTKDGTDIALSDGSMRVMKGVESVLLIPSQPNEGVSTTQFDRFNVGTKGLKIDNSSKANVILAEVTSANSPSKLRGNIRILENHAHFVLANPNGIECDGCSFSNVNGLPLLAAGKIGVSVKGKYPYGYKAPRKQFGMNKENSIVFKRGWNSDVTVTVVGNKSDLKTYSNGHEKVYHEVGGSTAIFEKYHAWAKPGSLHPAIHIFDTISLKEPIFKEYTLTKIVRPNNPQKIFDLPRRNGNKTSKKITITNYKY